MPAPAKRTNLKLSIHAVGVVKVTFTIPAGSPASDTNVVQYTRSGTGWTGSYYQSGPGASKSNKDKTMTIYCPIPLEDGYWGREWAFRVRGVNNKGTSPASEIVRIFVPGPPAQVKLPTISLTRPISVNLSWSAPNDNGSKITSYKVIYGTDPNLAIVSKSLTTTNRSVIITDAPVGVPVYFAVRAINAVGSGPYSSKANILIDGGPRVKVNGTFKHTVAYVKYNGSWKRAIPYVKHNGSWKVGLG